MKCLEEQHRLNQRSLRLLRFAMTKITRPHVWHWALGGQLRFATFCRTLKAGVLRRASNWYIVRGSGQFEHGKY